ncbi:MAG: hypothetical protein IT480_18920 [Gammaproteobacteria bacterium]|nr:hypothetical protein [Gammaproteobacteria bacterium]
MRTVLGFLALLGASVAIYGPLADFRYWQFSLAFFGWIAFMAFMASRYWHP